jgi:hypothetical protein
MKKRRLRSSSRRKSRKTERSNASWTSGRLSRPPKRPNKVDLRLSRRHLPLPATNSTATKTTTMTIQE